jgi:hypothetical protein
MEKHNSLYDQILELKKSDKSKFVLFLLGEISYSNCYGINFRYLRKSHHVGSMPPNVPAVCDVFAARIRACVARPRLQKCGWSEPWEAQPT